MSFPFNLPAVALAPPSPSQPPPSPPGPAALCPVSGPDPNPDLWFANPLPPACPHAPRLHGVRVTIKEKARSVTVRNPLTQFTPEWRDRLFQSCNVPCKLCLGNIKISSSA